MDPNLFPNPGDSENKDPTSLESPSVNSAGPSPNKFRYLTIGGIICAVLICAALTALVYFKVISPNSSQANNTTAKSQQKSTINRQALDDAYEYYKEAGVAEFKTADKKKVLDKADSLAAGFNILPVFFEDRLNSLFTLSTAYSSLQGKTNDKQFRAAMYMLMRDNLAEKPSDIEEDNNIEFNAPARDKKSIEVIKKYTDKDLTDKLNEAVKERDVYKTTAKDLSLDSTDAFKNVHVVALNFDQSSFKAFSKEHYMYGSSPSIWSEDLGGETYILATKDYAEDYVAKADDSVSLGIERILIHSVDSFVRGEYGRTISQRRADLFTGNKTQEYDIRQFFIYLEVFSGIDVIKDLETYPTSPEDFYLKIYKEFGLQTALRIVATSPQFYNGSKTISTYDDARLAFGGYDNALAGAIEIGQKDVDAMHSRMLKRAQKLYSVFKTKAATIEDLRYSMGRDYNMPKSAKIMEDYINTIDGSQLAKLESD